MGIGDKVVQLFPHGNQVQRIWYTKVVVTKRLAPKEGIFVEPGVLDIHEVKGTVDESILKSVETILWMFDKKNAAHRIEFRKVIENFELQFSDVFVLFGLTFLPVHEVFANGNTILALGSIREIDGVSMSLCVSYELNRETGSCGLYLRPANYIHPGDMVLLSR